MWKKTSSLLLVLVVLASAATAATTGDPLDGNEITASVEMECGRAALYPACQWCWTSCIYAILAEAWSGSFGGVDWGIR